MNIIFREPAMLAERIQEARRHGNDKAAAVSVDGAEPVYGELALADVAEPDRYTTFAHGTAIPRLTDWRVSVEGFIEPTNRAIAVAVGIHPDRLDITGNATWSQADNDGIGTWTTLMGNGPLTRDMTGGPA